jgi:hypothetical protein
MLVPGADGCLPSCVDAACRVGRSTQNLSKQGAFVSLRMREEMFPPYSFFHRRLNLFGRDGLAREAQLCRQFMQHACARQRSTRAYR